MPSHVVGAEPARAGCRFYCDAEAHIVAVDYFGSNGLRNAKLEAFRHLSAVNIVYGTTLTIDDISYLGSLSKITDLSIGQEAVDDPIEFQGELTPLKTLSSLEYLHLYKHDIADDDLEFVASLSNLKHLEFNAAGTLHDKTFAVTDRCATFLSKATALETIDAQGMGNLTDQFVAELTTGTMHLEEIRLSSPQLTDESLRLFAHRCPKLRSLEIYSDRISDSGVEAIAETKLLDFKIANLRWHSSFAFA
jgi:hypothetical protein